jgi:hypothetical protein
LLDQWCPGVVFCESVAVTKWALKSLYHCTEFSFASTSTPYSTDGMFFTIFLQYPLISIKISCKNSEAILGP